MMLEPPGSAWTVTLPVTASMRETAPGGPERLAIHLLPWESTAMPSAADVCRPIDWTRLPLASNSSTPVPPDTQAWPLASKAMSYGEPWLNAGLAITVPSGERMSKLPWMKRTTQTLPSGATWAPRSELPSVAVVRTSPLSATFMTSPEVRLPIQWASCAVAAQAKRRGRTAEVYGRACIKKRSVLGGVARWGHRRAQERGERRAAVERRRGG